MTGLPAEHDLRTLAEAAVDVATGDHRIVGRLFTPNRTIPITVRVATAADRERTVQVWGAVTGWSVTTATAEITSLEITLAPVYDGGLRAAMTEIHDVATHAATPAAQAAVRAVPRLLERLQPRHVQGATP
jgi:hypothetical protein